MAQSHLAPFGFFEFGLIGIPLLAAGLLYYGLIGHRFLPEGRKYDENVKEYKGVQRPEKMWISVGIFIFVVAAMATGFMPLTTAAIFGACLVVITRCMSMKEAFLSVDWVTIFLFAGMLSMSAAMSKSGAAAIVAHTVVTQVSDPWMLMLVCCALTALVTNFMSNTATAALMAPLALPIAVGGGVSPLPIMMGIAMSASACFLTPIATPPNTIVLTPGQYSFLDYAKAGWPPADYCSADVLAVDPSDLAVLSLGVFPECRDECVPAAAEAAARNREGSAVEIAAAVLRMRRATQRKAFLNML